MSQIDDIRKMGKEFGLDHSSQGVSEEDQLKSIAKSLGMNNYDGSDVRDTDELETRLNNYRRNQERMAANERKKNRATNLATAAGNKVAGPAGGYLAGKAAEKIMDRKNKKDDHIHEMMQRNADRNFQNFRNKRKSGGEQEGSPSSDSKDEPKQEKKSNENSGEKKKSNLLPDLGKKIKDSDPVTKMMAKIKRIKMIIIASSIVAAFLIVIVAVIAVISAVLGVVTDYDDAVGVSGYTGASTGGMSYGGTKEQNEFYQRVSDVELDFLSKGQRVDPLKIVAVYHVLKENGAKVDYSTMSESELSDIASSMLNGGIYDEDTFKSNLKNDIIPKYLPSATEEQREKMTDSVLAYVDNYYDYISEESPTVIYSNCSNTGICTYNIKGYYIKGKGNIDENVQVSNLYVRLMQCGTANGHNYGGTFGKALEGEELVPFEKYILGVAYQEIGAGAPAEAIKAQMVAARSYILARHADMGGWRTLQKEGNQWVIQVAACTQDQVYCDPDKGCSSNDGQWGQVHSGQGHGTGFTKGPLDQSSPLRTYANETSGEVLTNKDGYIIYSGYNSTDQNKMSSLAGQGLNYKQILLQMYSQGSRDYGASDIKKFSCTTGSTVNCRVSTGDYANWKQAGASWSGVKMGNSGRTIGQIGCLVTSISMLIAKSGVQTTIANFNPGTFVQFLNKNGGFDGYGNLSYAPISKAAPSFKWVDQISLSGMTKEQKLNTIRNYQNQGYYMTAEVSTNGQHWVAIDSVNGNSIRVMDPGSNVTDLWGSGKYTPQSTKTLNLFRVS